MFNLIPISLLIVALGGIIYIASNHLSKIDEDNEIDDVDFGVRTKFKEWLSRMPVEQIKSQSLVLTRKTLHKTRLALLKTDNYLMRIIGKISEKDKQVNDNNANNDPNFWDNLSNDKKEIVFTSEEFLKPVEVREAKSEIIDEAPKVDSLSKKKTVRAPRVKKTVK
ncbi:MAG: hypothetical protein V1905_03975 [bacterium]